MSHLARVIAIAAAGTLALAIGGVGVFAATKLLTPAVTAAPAVAAEQKTDVPPPSEAPPWHEPVDAPRYLEVHGLKIEDQPHVWGLLQGAMPCRTWMGVTTDQEATVMDLMRLRRRGYGSLPAHYRVHHESRGGYDYVIIEERMTQRDGSEVAGMPGFVQHRYLYDEARERFEHLDSTPEDPSFRPDLLRALEDPVSILTRRWDAVCNGRLSLPEVRAEMAARREARALAQAAVDAPLAPGAQDARASTASVDEANENRKRDQSVPDVASEADTRSSLPVAQ